jgi:hypothetical protein
MIRIMSALAAVALFLVVLSGDASADLQNGDFATNGGAGQLTVNTTLANWTGGGREGTFGSQTTPPVFVFTPGTTTQLQTTGVTGDAFMGNVRFWSATAAPGGGVIVAADGDHDWRGSISQNVSGLTVGGTYSLAFNWAGAQQFGFDGATTEAWQVTFGSSTLSTPTVSTPSHGFVGWQTAEMTFTATSASELLTFTADGTPGGLPPWLLLNGVTLTPSPAPEPSSAILFGVGVGVVVVGLRRRRAIMSAPSAG